MKFPYIYPDPESRRLRAALAADSGLEAEYILVGCGADELIDLIMRSVVWSFGFFEQFTILDLLALSLAGSKFPWNVLFLFNSYFPRFFCKIADVYWSQVIKLSTVLQRLPCMSLMQLSMVHLWSRVKTLLVAMLEHNKVIFLCSAYDAKDSWIYTQFLWLYSTFSLYTFFKASMHQWSSSSFNALAHVLSSNMQYHGSQTLAWM